MRRLTDDEKRTLNRRVAETESRTGAQVVLAVADRCDAYPEIPWKAFALAAATTGLLVSVLDRVQPLWSEGNGAVLTAGAALAVGAAAALLCIFIPPFAGLFLDRDRAEAETRQYAESTFLSRQVFATKGRVGVLVLIGVFERRVILLPDKGLLTVLDETASARLVAQVTRTLASGQIFPALERALEGLEEVLGSRFATPAGENELPDEVVEEDGP